MEKRILYFFRKTCSVFVCVLLFSCIFTQKAYAEETEDELFEE